MTGCRVVGADKPQVWKDERGWNCDQGTICLTCQAVSLARIAEDVTWEEAMEASAEALPVNDGGADE